MTLTVRLPLRLEQRLARYCVERGISKSEAVIGAIEERLNGTTAESGTDHPFIGSDRGDGSDVSGNLKEALRKRFRPPRR